ncbi:hypothetical protein L6R50_26740 [Myxococcota bacterium]|nr:hypothetical protein [Myxococcota bacterium]
MDADAFAFTGLDIIEQRLRRNAARIGYISLQDRTVRGADEPVGRFDFDEADAAPYLEPGPRASDDDTPADLDDLPDVEPEERAGDLTPEAIASAACRWLRETAANNTVGERSRRFRVRVFAPKANNFIFSATFVCHNEADDGDPDDAPLRLPDLPAPSWDQAVTDATMKPLRALGDGYAQFMKLVMATVGQFQGLNNSMHSRQHRQLREAQDQVEQLVASILEFRAAQVEAQEQRKADEHSSDARTELARHAIKQLGDAAQAFVLARGLPPDLAEVFGALGASPELMATLRDPSVRVLMKDPDNLRGLATMLRAAGAQAAAVQAAANGANATTAEPTPTQAAAS